MGIVVASCSASSEPVKNAGPCGNGKIDPGEDCDGTELGGKSCTGLGFTGGTLTCNPSTCKLEQSSCCADQCTLDDNICQGNVLAKCQLSAAGCLSWSQDQDCTTDSKICATSGGSVVCKAPGCVDQCFAAGQTQCNGTVIEICTIQENGCHTWEPGDDCADSDQYCGLTDEAAVCKTECTAQCADGDTQCGGNVIQECELVGDCMGWVNGEDCASGGEVCKFESDAASCGPSCTDNKCPTVGAETCMGNKVNTCVKQADTCLDWEVTQDCATTPGLVCKFGAGGVAACQGPCPDPCPTAGAKNCNSNVVQVCSADPTCAAPQWKTDETCPTGQICDPSNYDCMTAPSTGEDCFTVYPVQKGANTINWTATKNNYLLTAPSCATSYPISGPDVVLSYVAPLTGVVDFTINKPVSTRWTAVVAGGACGTVSAATQLKCVSDYSLSSMGGTFNVVAGSTYFFYVADTTNGANPLSKPFTLNITEIDCATFAASGLTFSPAKSATSNSLSPKMTVDFDTAVKTNVGTVTVTGNQGTNLSYPLPHSAVVFTNAGKTMTITPTVPLKGGEVINVNWTGMQDTICSKPLNAANWSFTVITPPCSPGVNGMLGTSVTKALTAVTVTPYYLAADTSLSGWVYMGNTAALYRASKTGSSLEPVHTQAGLTSTTHLGYAMAVNGNDIFTLKSKTTGTGWVWRITTTGGATWNVEDFITTPSPVPLDSWDATTIYEDKMYFLSSESTLTDNTQIWSVDATPGAVPTTATLETGFSNEQFCVGLAMDDTYFYVACGGSAATTLDRLLRVNRTSGAVTLISNSVDLNTTANGMVAVDTNNDGTADYLYFKGNQSDVSFVCGPAGATPYVDKLASYGTSTSSYGLGYDSVNKRLYAFDNGTKEIVTIQ